MALSCLWLSGSFEAIDLVFACQCAVPPEERLQILVACSASLLTQREEQTNAVWAFFVGTLKNRGAAMDLASCQALLGLLCFFSEFGQFHPRWCDRRCGYASTLEKR
jgi:hypothetical protein